MAGLILGENVGDTSNNIIFFISKTPAAGQRDADLVSPSLSSFLYPKIIDNLC